ncbi:hypothetical protein BKA70DRAFT_1375380 [Coprinopsis sp. MPI-PUGE-AT-0042]|nr:hypothetical protein BKA70DRAFT_1375380 [Coprinopsis sp. MPI-PUGE-AT-0042]
MPYVGIASLTLVASLSFGACKFISLWERVRECELAKERLSSDLRHTKQELSKRNAELKLKEDSVSALKHETEKSKAHITTLANALQSSERTNHELDRTSKELGGQLSRVTEELQGLRRQHHDAQELLGQRAQELAGAQTFLTTADTVSCGDIISMIQGMNADIMQVSAHMAETFTPLFATRGRKPSPLLPALEDLAVIKSSGEDFTRSESSSHSLESEADARDALAQAVEVYGATMVEHLQKTDPVKNPILLQLAFQAGLSAYTHWIITSWFFEDPEDEILFSETYARVREAEEQSISGQWRALTRKHAQRMMTSTNSRSPSRSPQMPPNADELIVYMVDTLVNVLLVSGLNEAPTIHTHNQLHSQIMAAFSSQLNVILSQAKRLNKAVGEGVVSCDLEALYVAPDAGYMPETMEASTMVESSGSRPPERVLCTTDLGLARAIKVPGTRGEWEESVLLKPKVILVAELHEILDIES